MQVHQTAQTAMLCKGSVASVNRDEAHGINRIDGIHGSSWPDECNAFKSSSRRQSPLMDRVYADRVYVMHHTVSRLATQMHAQASNPSLHSQPQV
jgi:hypothetical protein